MTPRAFFYCVPDERVHQNDVVVLAEGLRELGYELGANFDYWREKSGSADALLPRVGDHPLPNTDLVVLSSAWTRAVLPAPGGGFHETSSPLPPELFSPTRTYHTLTCDFDDSYGGRAWTAEYAAFDLILRAHFNRRCAHPANHRPWALGLSNRILDLTRHARPWSQRKAEILVNFGASHPFEHVARQRGVATLALAAPSFAVNATRDDLTREPEDDYDQLMWRQTQGCHCRAYYERLGAARAVAAFCGDLVPSTPAMPHYVVGGGRRAQLSRAAHAAWGNVRRAPERLIQWDSWRFWEALAAGCLVYHLDLDYYGVELPVQPVPFVHYVPVRLDNPAASHEPLARDPELAERIANQGREWALRHYAPRALAERCLGLLAA